MAQISKTALQTGTFLAIGETREGFRMLVGDVFVSGLRHLSDPDDHGHDHDRDDRHRHHHHHHRHWWDGRRWHDEDWDD